MASPIGPIFELNPGINDTKQCRKFHHDLTFASETYRANRQTHRSILDVSSFLSILKTRIRINFQLIKFFNIVMH